MVSAKDFPHLNCYGWLPWVPASHPIRFYIGFLKVVRRERFLNHTAYAGDDTGSLDYTGCLGSVFVKKIERYGAALPFGWSFVVRFRSSIYRIANVIYARDPTSFGVLCCG